MEAEAAKARELGLKDGVFGQEWLDVCDTAEPVDLDDPQSEVGRVYQEMVKDVQRVMNSDDPHRKPAQELLWQIILKVADDPLAAEPDKFWRACKKNRFSLSPQVYTQVAKSWGEQRQNLVEQSLPDLDKIKTDFIETITKNIEAGNLPVPLSVLERVKTVIFIPTDAIKSHTFGEMDIMKNVVYFSVQPGVDIEKTIRHELFHLIAGKRFKMELSALDQTPENVGLEKAGMSFIVGGDREFAWMDEAMTEHLTEKLFELEPEENGPYSDFIEVLQIFLEAGKPPIPEQLLLQAYFEQDGVEAWRTFSQAVRASFSDGFLVRFNRAVGGYPLLAKEIVERVKAGEDFVTVVEAMNKEVHVIR